MKKLLICFSFVMFLSGCWSVPLQEVIQTKIDEIGEDQTESPKVEEGGKTETVRDTAPPTRTETHTPTPSGSDWFLSEVEISSFHFFEAGENYINPASRNYANIFAQSEARLIYGEFNLAHPAPDEEITFAIKAVYYRPGGQVLDEVEIVPVIKPGWTTSNWIISYGWNDPGSWDAGKYRVAYFVGGDIIREDTFEIVKVSPTPESTATSTPMPGALVTIDSLNVRSGPDTVYSIIGSLSKGDLLDILGQAYSCAWLKIKMPNGSEGWVSSDLVEYEIPCSDIPAAAIPPTPIPQPTALPTNTDAPQGKTVSIKVINNTGSTLTLNLSGPASYSFTFATGTHTMQVIPGTYTYTAWGCGDTMSGTQKLQKGFEWTFYCN